MGIVRTCKKCGCIIFEGEVTCPDCGRFGYSLNSMYWDRINDIYKNQTLKGIESYGMKLEQNTAMTIEERISYLQEELVDGLMYCEHIKEKFIWHDASKEKPATDVYVLCIVNGMYSNMEFEQAVQMGAWDDTSWNIDGIDIPINEDECEGMISVDYWMEIPEPPRMMR